MAEAFTRSASAMALAGNTIDETMGLIVAGNEVVRDPAKVGTSLRSTSLRIRGMKTELEEIGEEVDDLVINTPKLQRELKALTGVDIMQSDGNTFKSTFNILKEISEVYDDLADKDAAAVL